MWHPGWWGPHVGFYGGVNYGYGYGGAGYEGGYWQGGQMFYNTAVVNVGTTHITNIYVKNVTVNNVTINRVSYNGGGVQARPTADQESYAKERHVEPVAAQLQQREARKNPDLRAKANGGNPTVAATPKPGVFKGAGVVEASGAPAHPAVVPLPRIRRRLSTLREVSIRPRLSILREVSIRPRLSIRRQLSIRRPLSILHPPSTQPPPSTRHRRRRPRPKSIRRPAGHRLRIPRPYIRPHRTQPPCSRAAPGPAAPRPAAEPKPAPKPEPREEPRG